MTHPTRALLLLAALLAPSVASAQLRPLEPTDWRDFDASSPVDLTVGAAAYGNQHASLAGTVGRLIELGSYQASWRTGRVLVQLNGTAFRRFDDRETFADPVARTRPPDGSTRTDAGEIAFSTLVALTDPARAGVFALRFGTRLPTTDNETGLERDQTDFFGTLGGRFRIAAAVLSAEVGLGIHGSRDPVYEQADVVLYGARLQHVLGPVTPFIGITGQWNTSSSVLLRGTEDLREARAGVSIGERYHLDITAVKGLLRFSPDYGARIAVGRRFGDPPR